MSEDQVLERFHRALIEEIQTQRPEYLTGPFTVAEIYQNLVPYGSHRERIGVEMNGDYEDALLRLLGGEGGFLILESEPALRNIRAELESAQPNTGLYREYAAVDVRLNQARLDLSAAAVDELSDLAEQLEAEVPVPMAELAPGEASLENLGIVPPGVDVFARSGGPTGAAHENGDGDAPATEDARPMRAGGLEPEFVEPDTPVRRAPRGGEPCAWCRATLPERANLNYCPYCGTDVTLVPCPQCREELEPTWRFCASCGTEVGG